jgi:hypothetical protein
MTYAYEASGPKICLYIFRSFVWSWTDLRLKKSQKGVIPIFLWLLFLWPIFLWPNLLCVDIPTKNLLKYRSILTIIDFSKTTHFNSQCFYVSIFQQTKAPTVCVNISTNQSSYVSILQQTRGPMYRYSYRPKLLFLQRLPVNSTTKAPMLRYFNFRFGFVGAMDCRNNGT